MDHHRLSYQHSVISYYRFGTGPIPVLCFHGYGENALSFDILEKELGTSYTFYAIELPFHGKTVWRERLDFSVTDLRNILTLLPLPTEIRPLLLGYSLGGRAALSLYESQPNAFSRIVLLAPDGLVLNPWYWLATQTYIGNGLFRFTMKHPGWFFSFLKILNKTGRLNPSVYKFVNAYIGNPSVRGLLYQRWTVLRKLKPDLSSIKQLIRQNETPVRLLFGKHDRIILSSRGEKFRKNIEEYCRLDILVAGHQLLQPRYVHEIKDALAN